jgi:enolase-phosphatase E1
MINKVPTVKAIVTDIEGTTSSISFVKEVLFPYAATNLPDFLRKNASQAAVQQELANTAALAGLDIDKSDEPDYTEELIKVLLQWIAEDRKATPLKALQGMIWAAGYEGGAYQAHVYEDAVKALQGWHARGLPLYVYSSGSIRAQKLFFQYSCYGDLRALFSDYFDTSSGAKQESGSYQTIAKEIGLVPSSILFLSDVAAELDAAQAVGMQVAHLVRPEDGTAPSGYYPSNASFDSIEI